MIGPKTRRLFMAAAILAVALILAACSDEDDEFVAIDVHTLEVMTDQGTAHGEGIPGAFVGELTEDLLIGVAVPEEGGPYHAAGDVIVYICDSETLATWFSTDRAGDAMTIAFRDITVDLEIGDDEVTGTVVIDDGEPMAFTANPATETSGLFTAESTFDGETYRGGWIVLEDGRQAGWWGNAWGRH